MLAENISSNIGKTDVDADKLASVVAVIKFLDKVLPIFPSLFKSKTSAIPVDPEDDVSQILWTYLERMARKTELFMVQFQYRYLKTRRSSDFGIIQVEDENPNEIDKAFFVIEAKRLPTPGKDKEGLSREKEYVSSNYGGIERYKRGHHGKALPESAIIGYIQDKQNCTHWQQKINNWIKELISIKTDIEWNSDDYLTRAGDFKTTRKYTSNNTRIVNSVRDSIRLYHYLIELS